MPDQPLTQPPVVHGLGYAKQRGKDTLARHLAVINPRVRSISLAWQLKEDLKPLCLDQWGIDPHTAEGDGKEFIRKGLLIPYGEMWRERDHEHWIKAVIKHIEKVHAQYPSYQEAPSWLVPDIRYPNEVHTLRAAFPGFRWVNVKREGAPEMPPSEARQAAAMERIADHVLEWGNDDEVAQLTHATEVAGWLGLLPEAKEEGT